MEAHVGDWLMIKGPRLHQACEFFAHDGADVACDVSAKLGDVLAAVDVANVSMYSGRA